MVIYHCFFRVFSLITEFYYLILLLIFITAFRQILHHDFFFSHILNFLLLYRDCYGFEKKRFFFSLRRSPRYTPSPYLAKPTLLLSRLPWKQAVLP